MTGTNIRVVITEREIEKLNHDVWKNITVNRKLRAAGIPIVGKLSIFSVERGRLTMYWDEANRSWVYEYTGPTADLPANDEDEL